jgi:bisphosphoglycerate-independent phosphoglycerate mutase (AlkP superfamily)
VLSEFHSSAHYAVHMLGKCSSGLVHSEMQEADRLAARLLLAVLPAYAADAESGDLAGR